MLHILDEPTIGQHPADVARLLPVLRRLAGPVIYVEHDRSAAAEADQAIDIGPGAGSAGGQVIYTGTPAGLWQADTPTGRYFSQRQAVPIPAPRPRPEQFLMIRGAALRNLRDIDLTFPLGRLTVITGVSGSGKSTLIEEVLLPSLLQHQPVGCRAIEGPAITSILVDQDPIGQNPRSNPATYTKLADLIRDCFAAASGLSASHFSFNRPEGACPTCQGMGAQEVRMSYLPPTWIPCPDCDGQRFSDEVLAARVDFGGRWLSIADFYALSIREAAPLLLENSSLPPSRRRAARQILDALIDTGLGYLELGQPSPTLSGGEAQRVKLAKFLGKSSLSDHLLILDEPSTGLHPQDISGLLIILDRLARSGATIVVVEHSTDVIRAADWVLDLGPGAGPAGGQLIYAGPPAGLLTAEASLTGRALRQESALQPRAASSAAHPRPAHIAIRNARANNLTGVDVDFPKGALTVVTGVSGSGKSSLVGDVLESEARRRFLETLSMYERQGTREGPEAAVDAVSGLGVAVTLTGERRVYERRATLGTATEIAHHLAILLTSFGERPCPNCAQPLRRQATWVCPNCAYTAPLPQPRHFNPWVYGAACTTCHGVGTLQIPCPEKLIIHPEKPLIAGAMYSPGFFPNGYLGKPYNGGNDLLLALGARFGFDPATTPWNELSPEVQSVFLYGDNQPMEVIVHSRAQGTFTRTATFPGFYGWIRDWDVGGTYTRTETCPDCAGSALRPAYASVTLTGYTSYQLSEMPLAELLPILRAFNSPAIAAHLAAASLNTALRRIEFLLRVGLGYLHLNRISATLSAGEAQRVRLAGLLGSGLTALTVLLDEPTRGLHPREIDALLSALFELRDEGNTLIVVEHDLNFMRAADYLVDVGPGPGLAGGQIVARGTPAQVAQANTLTAAWLRAEKRAGPYPERRTPNAWLTLRGARANNLRSEMVRFPLGVLVGICGVSGSGKSTLVIDTLARALAPHKHSTSVAQEPFEPGPHDAIEGAPARVILVDQVKTGLETPSAFLGLDPLLRALFAASEEAGALGLDESAFNRGCSACGGRGALKTELEFLPALYYPCEVCRGSGLRPEAWDVHVGGLSLPEVYTLPIERTFELFCGDPALAAPLAAARQVGLGYLVLHQPGHTLSGGEAQRLKIARELCQKAQPASLYILDEPTVGQHLEDVARLNAVLHHLVAAGHSVFVVEHHPHLLAACDWLIELGPGGGPQGGRVIAAGTPEDLAKMDTPIGPYLKEVLG